jgi:hypothetical protein
MVMEGILRAWNDKRRPSGLLVTDGVEKAVPLDDDECFTRSLIVMSF